MVSKVKPSAHNAHFVELLEKMDGLKVKLSRSLVGIPSLVTVAVECSLSVLSVRFAFLQIQVYCPCPWLSSPWLNVEEFLSTEGQSAIAMEQCKLADLLATADFEKAV